MTPAREQLLIGAAQQGVRNAYTKDGKPDEFRIGAAVLTSKGNVYSSGHYFSDTASLTLHAEQAVLCVAASHGDYAIDAIAVTWNEAAEEGDADGSIYPCHMCKQLLWESYLRSKREMKIICVNPKGVVLDRLNLKDIMNYTWPK